MGQMNMFGEEIGENAEYEAFVEKFKPKKTTDDCYTPDIIYDTVAEWVAEEYGVDRGAFVRPFWPGGDFEAFDYPAGCVVVDNPPFSILARIQRFYVARGIRFFLFAPTLTLFSGRGLDVCYVPCGVQVVYANGAKVNTSFVTNMDVYRLRTAPELYRRIRIANDIQVKSTTRKLPKYNFPPEVLTAAAAYQLSHYGQDFRVMPGECRFIASLDAMKARGKDSGIFGGAFLLSETAAAERAAAERAAAERAAAERAAAERAAAHVWELSDRERQIVASLGNRRGAPGWWFIFYDLEKGDADVCASIPLD